MELFQRRPFKATPEWLEFLKAFTAQAAVAIDNAGLHAREKRS